MRTTKKGRKAKKVILPFVISVLIAIGAACLVFLYLPVIVFGIMMLIIAGLVFAVVFAASWFLMTLILLPYYALTKVKPNEKESRGGYRLSNVAPAQSETIEPKRVKHKGIFCPNCGARIELPAEFCPNCGSKLS